MQDVIIDSFHGDGQTVNPLYTTYNYEDTVASGWGQDRLFVTNISHRKYLKYSSDYFSVSEILLISIIIEAVTHHVYLFDSLFIMIYFVKREINRCQTHCHRFVTANRIPITGLQNAYFLKIQHISATTNKNERCMQSGFEIIFKTCCTHVKKPI